MLERARVTGNSVPHVAVRPATAADLDRITAIEQASFSDPWSRRAFQGLLGDRRVFFAVACLPKDIVSGYVAAWFIADQGEIANLAVSPEARGQHLGSLLLDTAIGAARGRGVSSIYLEVRDSNQRARALYASRGFIEVGRRRHYYRRPTEDALVLRLVLPAT